MGITIEQFADGKLVEDWTNFDALGLMQQLGLIPEQWWANRVISYLHGRGPPRPQS
jgi:hypothetical protein